MQPELHFYVLADHGTTLYAVIYTQLKTVCALYCVNTTYSGLFSHPAAQL